MTLLTLREIEKESIRSFVMYHSGKLGGRVLDYGCGQQPYRDIVENVGGEYVGHDMVDYPASTVSEDVGPPEWPLRQLNQWDAILCTQVIQYLSDPLTYLRNFYAALNYGGWLVMTGPTNWPEVEVADMHRFTAAGITVALERAGFSIVEVNSRAKIGSMGEEWSLGWGATARA